MRTLDFISAIFCVAFVVMSYDYLMHKKDMIGLTSQLDSSIRSHQVYIDNLNLRVDSLKANEATIAKSIMYLDSVQVDKKAKGDKAERRGRFLGGLLKGLIPGL